MILFFSVTGNTRYVAQTLAGMLEAEAIEYGGITPGKKRYLFKKYRYAAEDGGNPSVGG